MIPDSKGNYIHKTSFCGISCCINDTRLYIDVGDCTQTSTAKVLKIKKNVYVARKLPCLQVLSHIDSLCLFYGLLDVVK